VAVAAISDTTEIPLAMPMSDRRATTPLEITRRMRATLERRSTKTASTIATSAQARSTRITATRTPTTDSGSRSSWTSEPAAPDCISRSISLISSSRATTSPRAPRPRKTAVMPENTIAIQAAAVGAVGRRAAAPGLVLGPGRRGRGPPPGGEPLPAGLHPQHRGTCGDERAGEATGGQAGDEDGHGEERQAEPRGAVGLADVPAEDRGRTRADRRHHAGDPQQLGGAGDGQVERGEGRLGQDLGDRLLGLQRAQGGHPLPHGEQHHHRGEHDDARRQGDLGRTLRGGLAHPAIVPSGSQPPPTRTPPRPRGRAGGHLRVDLRGRRGPVPDAPECSPPRGWSP
jgi:hypothetical protein